jgi:hypothetical protein
MGYIRTDWRHNDPDLPVEIWSELDADQWETRKVERFADGRLTLAGWGLEVGDSFLSIERMPPLDEIDIPELTVTETSAQEFESVWARALESNGIVSQEPPAPG